MVVVPARRLAPTTLNAVDYGFRAGASAATLRAALAAGVAALPAVGGELYLPAGTYACGGTTAAAILTIARSNVTLRGAGMGRTILTYSSARSSATLGPGTCMQLGDDSATYSQITISDLTLIDLNTVNQEITGHNPSALEAHFVNNLLVERVEVVNAKGNSAINVVGSRDGDAPGNSHVVIQDCLLRGDLAGGWIEGDGINVGNYGYVRIVRNTIIGPRRHGIEGGGNRYAHISENTIDMLSAGLNAIGTATFGHGTISNNLFRNIPSDPSAGAIAFTTDDDVHAIGSTTITGNVMESDANTNGHFVLWQVDPAGMPGPVVVVGNRIQSRAPVYVPNGPVYLLIEGNTFDLQAGSGPLVGTAGTGFVLGAGEFIDAKNNVLHNVAGSATKIFQSFATATDWKSPRVRASGNTIGATHDEARTGQADGGWAIDQTNLGSIANGAASPVRSVSMPGALAGDQVTCAVNDGQVLPSGTHLLADVSVTDTIEWQLLNLSGGAVDPGTLAYHFRIERR